MDISKDQILRKRVDMLYKQASSAIIGMVCIAVILCVMLYQLASPSDNFTLFMTTWLVCITVISAFRLYIVALYHKRPELMQTRYWLYFYVFWIAVSGIFWNILFYKIAFNLEQVYIYFFILTLAGMSGGAVVSYNTSFLAFAVMAISTLIPMSIIALMLPNELTHALGFFLIAYFIFLLTVSYRLCKQITEHTFNELVIQRLENEKKHASLINEELETEIRQRVETEGKLKDEKDKAEALAEALFAISSKDGLTGLNNRRRFDEYLENEWNRCMRAGEPLTLILCDIDCYKSYNDFYGHLAGDDCLKKIAGVLQHYTRRATDFAARYGGEEFAIILSNTDSDKTFTVAEEIRTGIEGLRIPHETSTVNQYVTVSLGVVNLVPSQDKTIYDLINLADQALYEAKANGRNRTVLCENNH